MYFAWKNVQYYLCGCELWIKTELKYFKWKKNNTHIWHIQRVCYSGMLSAALESYFKAELPDIMIVPISISYERILEESIYAYEMLGVPKPKESASVSSSLHKVSFFFKCPSRRLFSTINIHFQCDALVFQPSYVCMFFFLINWLTSTS